MGPTRALFSRVVMPVAMLVFPGAIARGQSSCNNQGTACEAGGCQDAFEIYPDADNPFRPISDLSQPNYEVNGCIFEVGKYPGRTNEMPPAHVQAGLDEGQHIFPRGPTGQPDPENGLIGVLSIGNSNVVHEFNTFRDEQIVPLRLPDVGGLNERLVFLNGAKSQNGLCEWSAEPDLDSDLNPWGAIFLNRLTKGRQPGLGKTNVLVDPLQVQVIWIKGHAGLFIGYCQVLDCEADPELCACDCAPDLCAQADPLACDPPGEPADLGAGAGCQFPNWVFDAQDGMLLKFQTVLTHARELFPNLRQVFITNRVYTGYAGDFDSCAAFSPEPWAYQNGFMVKALIGQQIDGLMPFGDSGPYPWIAWGPEFWGNGTLDGWFCYHFCADGAHTSNPEAAAKFGHPESGQTKLAGILMDFFRTDAIASPWFLAAEPASCAGDANGDGTVDPLDSGFVLARFGCPVGTGDPTCDAADQNGDGNVDPLDSGFVLARFGDCP